MAGRDGQLRATVEVVLDDPRLDGWVQTTPLWVQPGDRVVVEAVDHHESGGKFDRIEFLTVLTRTFRGGDVAGFVNPHHLFFERPRNPDARTLEKLAGILCGALGIEALPEDLAAWDTPDWPGNRLAPLQNSIFAQLVAFKSFAAELRVFDSALADRVERMLDQAYWLGRTVREQQLKDAFEDIVDKADLVKGRQSAAAAATAEIRRKAKSDRLAAVLRLANAVLDEAPTRDRDDLAAEMLATRSADGRREDFEAVYGAGKPSLERIVRDLDVLISDGRLIPGAGE